MKRKNIITIIFILFFISSIAGILGLFKNLENKTLAKINKPDVNTNIATNAQVLNGKFEDSFSYNDQALGLVNTTVVCSYVYRIIDEKSFNNTYNIKNDKSSAFNQDKYIKEFITKNIINYFNDKKVKLDESFDSPGLSKYINNKSLTGAIVDSVIIESLKYETNSDIE